jgi:ribosomal protein L11 methyltransferase
MDSSAGVSDLSSKSSKDSYRDARLKTMVMELLESKSHRMTPAGMTKALRSHQPDLTGSMIRQAIRSLVEQGDLTYSDRFGRTYVELNYFRVRRITDRITLSPPDCSLDLRPDEVLIKIHNGVSFGMGDHPTTRIALRGVEYAMTKVVSQCESKRIRTLDIGTGSGVLAIASIKLGANKAYGLDLDPVACHEARKNVLLNGLNASVSIHETDLDRFHGECCELLIANLRPPTLKQIIPTLHLLSRPAAFWVFSGFREAEALGLKDLLSSLPAKLIWQDSEHGWSGMVVAQEDYFEKPREKGILKSHPTL